MDTSIENPTNVDKLVQYTNGYESIGYVAVGAGLVLLLISPLLKKLMKEGN
ncbi:hypothetical protein D3C80_1874010 [compost metagenome]